MKKWVIEDKKENYRKIIQVCPALLGSIFATLVGS